MWQLLAIAAAGQLYSGYSQQKALNARADLIAEQGAIQRAEAFREAVRIREEGYRAQQEQIMQAISSGVEAAGTPMLLALETEHMANTEAQAEEARGQAAADLANANKDIMESEGRAALFSSIISAGTTFAKGMK